MYRNRPKAEGATVAIFGGNGLNDSSDAFRHAFFNALNARDTYSSIADAFGKAHECGVPEEKQKEKQMDLHNNSVGNSLGSQNKGVSDEELAILVLEAIKRGEMKILNNLALGGGLTLDSNLVSSSSCL